MTVRDVKTGAGEWVYKEAIHIPGFYGAFLHGSINWLNDEDQLPPASDIDIIVVLTNPNGTPPGKFNYGSLLLEVSYLSIDELRTAEQVLGKFYLAGSFRKPGIIADKDNHLTTLQQQVAAQYANAYWARKRCAHARELALSYLDQQDESAPLHDQVTSWLFARGLMVHMLLVAGLKNPTVRKRYLEVKRLLQEYSPEFYERLLQSVGFASLGRPQVERHLASLTAAFDAACAVIKTPYRFAADISITGRPIAIGGSEELVKAGYHREAMFWIIATYCRCRHVLAQDAPLAVQEQHNKGFIELLEGLHIASFDERRQTNQVAAKFIVEVTQVAELIIAQNPEVIK